MKALGVDAESGLAHSLATTALNAADVTQACVLLLVTRRRHGATRATRVWTSARRTGVADRPGGDEAAIVDRLWPDNGSMRLGNRSGNRTLLLGFSNLTLAATRPDNAGPMLPMP